MSNQISRSKFLKNVTIGGLGIGALLSSPFPSVQAAVSSQQKERKNFVIRGFHIDERVEVVTMPALKKFAKKLSGLGVNALVMEYEAAYPFQEHATITGRDSYSRDEIKDFVSYCDSLGIQVIPLLENMGHVEYILRHDRYADLRIERSIVSQVDPLNKETLPFFKNLIEDMISLHPSKYIHLGGDETRQLDHEKFADYIEEHGISKLYTQYMKQMCRIAIDKGKTPLLWADMILQYPEAVEDLPIEQIIFVDWNYGWNINNFGDIKALQKKGCTFWGAPALRSSPDNYFLSRWEYHFNNIKDFVPYTRKAGYEGIFMTSWSTSGVYDHQWQGTSRIHLDMYPRRNLYPLAGFNILVDAYSKAITMKNPIDPHQFVIDYGQRRFGFSKTDSKVLWNYLNHEQVILRGGKKFLEKDIANIRNQFHQVSAPIHQLQPSRNKQEFEHFKLMADIRLFYLSVRQVESFTESADFNHSQISRVKDKLAPLLQTSKELDQRFTTLQEGYLFGNEIKRLNNLRNKRLEQLQNIYGD